MSDDREQRIREAAYKLWQDQGQPEGQHEQHWQEACRLVDGGGESPSGAASGLQPGGTIPGGGPGATVGSVGTGGGSTAGAPSGNAA